MGVRNYTELNAWKLAASVRSQVLDLTNRVGWTDHFALREQLRGSAHSGCANIAEGFARYQPKDFARFLRIARGSLTELLEHVTEAESRKLVEATEASTLRQTTRRATGAITALILYLQTAKPR